MNRRIWLVLPAALGLLLGPAGPASRAHAEDFGGAISEAFTDAYKGLRDGILGAYQTSRKGAVETFADVEREAKQAWQEHGPAPKAALKPGSADGALVASVQAELAAAGYDPGPADGRYGPRTADAIRAFQRDHALAEDGQVSPALLDALRAGRAPSPPGSGAGGIPSPGAERLGSAMPRLPGDQTAQRQSPGVGACTPFEQRTTVEGRETVTHGLACLQPNGTWKTVN